MTNPYLNLPGHCFVNEINSVNQINVNEINSVNQIENHDEQNDFALQPEVHNIGDQTPAYVTNNNQTLSQPDKLSSNNIETHGITLAPDMLTAFGFTSEQNITLFITQGRIVITTHPKHLALMSAIEELQLRQDEIQTDFTDAIKTLAGEL